MKENNKNEINRKSYKDRLFESIAKEKDSTDILSEEYSSELGSQIQQNPYAGKNFEEIAKMLNNKYKNNK